MMKHEISDEQYVELDDLITGFLTIHFDDPYWFDLANGEYCLVCANKLQIEHPDWQKDGGFCIDSDSTLFCESCGKPLECTLTDYGAKQELEYFEREGFDFNRDLDKYTAVNISGGIPLCHQRRLYDLLCKKRVNDGN